MSQTLRKRVEETEADLHEVERIYERMVEQATDLIYIFDLDMRFVILNQQTVDMFVDLLMTEEEGLVVPPGADKTQGGFWRGKRLDELVRPGDSSFMRKKIDEVLKINKSIAFGHTIKPKDRQIRLSSKLIPIRDDEGHVHYILGISRDMTEKEEVDQRIYSAEKLASIGILASGVAHEINNPLAVILGFTDLLLERFPEDSQEYEDLKLIEQNANHAKKVVQDLLGFARITEGLEETVDVKKSIGIVTRIAENTLMTQKIKLRTDIPDNLPTFRGDSREFQQVIFNLMNNAVAAMTADESGKGELTLSVRTDRDWVHVNVADNGVGIPNRIKPQIFDPFFTTKKPGEGTGLGLSLCYGIVKKYGGKMSFSSVSAEDYPDRPTGTTFVVSMPIYHGED
jgi:signal transduction histidine kinase